MNYWRIVLLLLIILAVSFQSYRIYVRNNYVSLAEITPKQWSEYHNYLEEVHSYDRKLIRELEQDIRLIFIEMRNGEIERNKICLSRLVPWGDANETVNRVEGFISELTSSCGLFQNVTDWSLSELGYLDNQKKLEEINNLWSKYFKSESEVQVEIRKAVSNMIKKASDARSMKSKKSSISTKFFFAHNLKFAEYVDPARITREGQRVALISLGQEGIERVVYDQAISAFLTYIRKSAASGASRGAKVGKWVGRMGRWAAWTAAFIYFATAAYLSGDEEIKETVRKALSEAEERAGTAAIQSATEFFNGLHRREKSLVNKSYVLVAD